jgi:hypothetical protein
MKAPSYSLPPGIVLRLAAAGVLGRKRSLLDDAAVCLRTAPPWRVEGREHIPATGPFLVVVNHFKSPEIGIWWPMMALSTALPKAPNWVMTSGWTYSDWLRRGTLEPLTAWAFARVARVYGLTTMPPMPPRAHEVMDRAAAIRKVIEFIRLNPTAVVGLAPEGQDNPNSSLGWPAPGSGRFILRLAERLGQVLPAGVSIENQELTIRFGPPFCPQQPPSKSREQLDQLIARQVMEHIARLLPAGMRGEFLTERREKEGDVSPKTPIHNL